VQNLQVLPRFPPRSSSQHNKCGIHNENKPFAMGSVKHSGVKSHVLKTEHRRKTALQTTTMTNITRARFAEKKHH